MEEGWPLGLRPVIARVGLTRDHPFSGSVSFTTFLTGSPSSYTDSSSSDLDNESTGSIFHDKSITLGSLIGISNISRDDDQKRRNMKMQKPWLFSLCSRLSRDAAVRVNNNSAHESLGHFLEQERRAAASSRTNSHKENIDST